MPEWAWPFLVRTGVSTLSCTPYLAVNGTAPKKCQTQCANATVPLQRFHAQNYTQAGDFLDAKKHVSKVMSALMTGPLDATFLVYEDFMQYKAGEIYQHKWGRFAGIHSVKIVGFGEDAGVPFWTVQNSWGEFWGDKGFFKILRGVDECMFESQGKNSL
jgi:cathepsin B